MFGNDCAYALVEPGTLLEVDPVEGGKYDYVSGDPEWTLLPNEARAKRTGVMGGRWKRPGWGYSVASSIEIEHDYSRVRRGRKRSSSSRWVVAARHRRPNRVDGPHSGGRYELISASAWLRMNSTRQIAS